MPGMLLLCIISMAMVVLHPDHSNTMHAAPAHQLLSHGGPFAEAPLVAWHPRRLVAAGTCG